MNKSLHLSVRPLLVTMVGLSVSASAVQAVEINKTYLGPSLDRWMYSFNTDQGNKPDAAIFAPYGHPTQPNFDDRDGQLLVGFVTVGDVPPGQGVDHYRIISATVTATVSPDSAFAYDSTPDTWDTYSQSGGVAPVPDSDAGRSIELYLAGYRAGWSLATFLETSRYAGAASDPLPPGGVWYPARGIRNVFPAQYEPAGSGIIRDVSNNVDEMFEPRPVAIARNASLTPGQIVPVGTPMTFDFDLSNPDTRRYLREGLNAGQLNFVISSLAEAQIQTPQTVRFYCKEAGVPNTAPTLNIRVCVGAPADWDCSGAVGVSDLFKFLDEWFAGSADFDENGQTGVADLFAFLDAWFATFGT